MSSVGYYFKAGVLVAANEKGVCAIFLGDDENSLLRELSDEFAKSEVKPSKRLSLVADNILIYMANPSTKLDIDLDIRGTDFQKRIWAELQKIPLGTRTTYSELAKNLGMPKAYRAVANACAANLLAVVIPCHRVVRSNGNLSGYRWGVELKKRLLEVEARKL